MVEWIKNLLITAVIVTLFVLAVNGWMTTRHDDGTKTVDGPTRFLM